MMAAGKDRPLRLLCLHGYRQSGTSFREKTGALRKQLKKHAEFVFITSPVEVPSIDDSQDKESGCGWWFSRPDNYFKAQDESECIKGFEESLKAIESCFKESGPFDGILGFSQGAAMLGLLCGLQQQGKLQFSFKFAIFASAFRSRSSPHQYLYSERITLPTLHIYGEADQVIEKALSEEFLQYFHEPQTLLHPGGHFIPATGTQKATYVHFLENMKKLCIV
ncbi:esterase OVCA2 [Procambarus clarkii]|uniref:esterase OVCA2 n=1 Tax=Procambarus clarkii TaxID=6728 RepID=UPI001E673B68|nr:esterase OVCA2-like [Procambarus clarkii]XP_045597682.1 esterase OVCA2-like [Procambarus clarkii]XP_045597683.1 esterase OVCA2-like [Procambarus clarkii]XP_045597685.1 esterase OVCA2-like [Procambarus clarkii]XP_045597686.1 esterase OVCA2-like [Procambarus clarkii]XP_045597687.1 esterase OVCA2-like [Procambarus clarkii]